MNKSILSLKHCHNPEELQWRVIFVAFFRQTIFLIIPEGRPDPATQSPSPFQLVLLRAKGSPRARGHLPWTLLLLLLLLLSPPLYWSPRVG